MVTREELIANLASLPAQAGPAKPDGAVSPHSEEQGERLVVGPTPSSATSVSASRGSAKAQPGDGLGIEPGRSEGGGGVSPGCGTPPLPVQPQLDESKCCVCGEPTTHGISQVNKEHGCVDHWSVCTAHKDLNKGEI